LCLNYLLIFFCFEKKEKEKKKSRRQQNKPRVMSSFSFILFVP
jgi:hypothetical protein